MTRPSNYTELRQYQHTVQKCCTTNETHQSTTVAGNRTRLQRGCLACAFHFLTGLRGMGRSLRKHANLIIFLQMGRWPPLASARRGRSMKAPAQCCGFAASSCKRCSVVAGSHVKDKCGRRAALPLELGAKQCLFHLELFHLAVVEEALIFYLDFETSGLDLGLDSIVEIGLLGDSGACFQTVVRPRVFGNEDAAVHGISNNELLQGPDFAEAFSRMSSFVEGLLDMSLDSTCTRISDVRPSALIVAHNGKSFDVPFLVSELYTQGIDPACLSRWRFADSIDLARACQPFPFIFGRGCIVEGAQRLAVWIAQLRGSKI